MATPKQQPMCAVTIGFDTYLMPAAAGMKVVELMQQAVTTDRTYGTARDSYEAGEPPQISFQVVRPSQIRMQPGADIEPAGPKRITKQPLRLTRKGD